MKLVGFAQCYNELSKGNLRRCLDSMSRYCDSICVYDDGSSDGSVDVASTYSNVHLIRGQRNDFNKELFHKEQLLKLALSLNPDWIFWMDFDEVIEKRGEDGALRDFAQSAAADGYTFHEVNLWRSEKYYRVDNQFNAGLFCRLWRNNGGLSYAPTFGLHHRQYPDGLRSIKDCDIQILHYGFASDESIINKYTTYKSNGQTGWALYRLIDESSLSLAKTKPEWLGREPEGRSIEEINQPIMKAIYP